MNVAVAWADSLMRASWQAGLTSLAAWLVLRVVPGISPVVRSWVWRLVMLKFLAVLFLTVPLPTEAVSEVIAAGGNPTPLALGVLVLSVLGAAVVVDRAIRDYRAVAEARELSFPVDEATVRIAREVAREMGLRRTPRVRWSESLAIPALVGLRRPLVLLPESFLMEASAEELRMALAHEMAHLRRRDLAWAWVGALTRAVFFFHPLALLALRESQAAEEAACDELAISRLGASRKEYGRLILRLSVGTPLPAPSAAAMAGSLATVRRRLDALSRSRSVRFTPSAFCLLLALTAFPGYRFVSLPISSPNIAPSEGKSLPIAAPAAAKLGRWAPVHDSTSQVRP